MDIRDVDVLRLLPAFMCKDAANIALADAVSGLIQDIGAKVDQLRTWDQIDNLDDVQLDELAWELNIDWYSSTADTAVKRRIIKDAPLVQGRRGTKWAVERVINAYFGSGTVEEWFEYGGKPYCFRIISNNPIITKEKVSEFLNLLNLSKRASAHLEKILITLTEKMLLRPASVVHEVVTESYAVKNGGINGF